MIPAHPLVKAPEAALSGGIFLAAFRHLQSLSCASMCVQQGLLRGAVAYLGETSKMDLMELYAWTLAAQDLYSRVTTVAWLNLGSSVYRFEKQWPSGPWFFMSLQWFGLLFVAPSAAKSFSCSFST